MAANSLSLGISRLNRFRSVIRWRDHLSSGEKRAGCADLVTWPSSTFLSVYRRLPLLSRLYMRCILAGVMIRKMREEVGLIGWVVCDGEVAVDSCALSGCWIFFWNFRRVGTDAACQGR